MKRKLLCVVMILVIGINLLTACGSSTGTPTGTPAATPAATPSGTPADTSAPADSSGGYVYEPIPKKNYAWGTAGPSSTHYVVAAGVSNLINKQTSSANFVVQSTAGATENLSLMLDGELDFGYMTANSVYNGYYKTGNMADKVPEPYLFNAVMTTHGSTGQMLVKVDSGIKSFADLKGKKVCTGTTSVEGHTVCETLIGTYGLDVKNDMETVWLEQGEAAEKLQDGDLDAVYMTGGYPLTAYMNLIVANPGKYTLLQADIPNLQKVVDEMPYLQITEIPAGTYPGVDISINALRTAAIVITPADTPNAVTYELAKYTYENWAEIQGVHAALGELDASNLADVIIPLHPGAEAFFKSVGVIK
jgi:TRAP transporter TAXI family solute receptor